MTVMLDKLAKAIELAAKNNTKSSTLFHDMAKSVITALREPDTIDPKILLAMDHYKHAGYNKMWDAALDQIIDPD